MTYSGPRPDANVLIYMPTYAPDTESVLEAPGARGPERLTNPAIAERINRWGFLSRIRPHSYWDAIDSVVNTVPEARLVVADARSTDSMRAALTSHYSLDPAAYRLELYPARQSQWTLFNDVMRLHMTPGIRYIVYTSSDIIWPEDWLAKALTEFEADPRLQILFPMVNSGDPVLPCQVAPGPRDLPLIDPASPECMDCEGMRAARAPCLNMYAAVFRREFFKTYGGYMTAFRNCHSESFLYYQCEAMGGKMRLSPGSWLYHHNGIDAWTGEGGSYNYTAEHPRFHPMMDEVQVARAAGAMNVDFLRRMLYV